MEVRRVKFRRGKPLQAGENSAALYGVIGTRKNVVLRIHLRKELAEMYVDGYSRHLEEIYLEPD